MKQCCERDHNHDGNCDRHPAEHDTITSADRLSDLSQEMPPGTATEFKDLPFLAIFGLYAGDRHSFIKTGSTTARLIVTPGGRCLNQVYSFGLCKPVITQ